MSFGQALFFGAAGYSVALLARDLEIASIFIVLPAALAIGVILSLAFGTLLLHGRNPPITIFVALGSLRAPMWRSERLARGRYYIGGQNGIPSIPPMTFGRYEFVEGRCYYYLSFSVLVIVYLYSQRLFVKPRYNPDHQQWKPKWDLAFAVILYAASTERRQ